MDVRPQGTAAGQVVAPEAALQLLATDQGGSPARQLAQDAEARGAHPDLAALPRDPVPGHIDADVIHPQLAALGVLLRAAPPQQGPDAGLQLAQGKGLDQIVVGPGIQAQHAVGHGIAGRQHDDRHLHAVFPAQGAAQADAVQAGEHDVQHHQVELAGRRHLEARTAVAGAIQFIAQGLQIGVQVGEDVLVIFHQQDRDRHHAHLRKKGRGAVRPLKDGKTGGRTAVKKAPQGRNITG